ncbi:hypothetical protein HY793_03500, partial [Candidatus Desantisbacteria bacterium]|nr:hypothetical protein [Candidatus Desantisbacteria bacterium]
MKQIILVAVFLSLFLTVGTIDAKWIPEDATSEDIKRLITMEKEDKERIIREQKAEQREEEMRNATPEGVIGNKGEKRAEDSGREISSGVSSVVQQQAVSGVPGISTPDAQQQAASRGSGKSTLKQTIAIVNQGEGKAADIEKLREIKKTGWKDWLVIGLFLSISIGFLIFYFYSINKINKKITNRHAASKGITLVEILVATVIVAISILCILKAIQQSSLVQPHTGETTMAVTLCQEKLEELRSMPYGSLTVGTTIESPKISMPPYGWNENTPINGGATRSVTIKKIQEVWHEGASPTFEETTGDEDY